MQTERLTYRRFTKSDLSFIHSLHNDKQVMQFIDPAPVTFEEIENNVAPLMLENAHDKTGFWLAEHAGELVGWFSLRLESDEEAELGYRLLPICWGRGFATEGALQMIKTGFEDANLKRVYANTYEKNLGSIGVMRKAGMRFVKNFKWPADGLADVWEGFDVLYEITRDEYLKT